MRKTVGIIASALVGLLLLGSAPASAGSGSCYTYSKAEKSFAKKMNNARDNAG